MGANSLPSSILIPLPERLDNHVEWARQIGHSNLEEDLIEAAAALRKGPTSGGLSPIALKEACQYSRKLMEVLLDGEGGIASLPSNDYR